MPQTDPELLLIIDELGLKEDQSFVGDTVKLKTIQNKVQKEIATRVQILLACGRYYLKHELKYRGN